METDSAAQSRDPLYPLRRTAFWLSFFYEKVRGRLGLVTVGPVRARRTFRYAGKDYRYYVARYNDTWANERSVELAIALDLVSQHAGGEILEVGNVLNHYLELPHDVVDKYEQAPGIVNDDVLAFSPSKRYDLIVSISTLEHIGFDENERDPDKPARTVVHLRSLLRPGGRLLITFPLGHNPYLDANVAAGALELDELHFLKRVSRRNRWLEVSAAEVVGSKYGAPYSKGNAIAVATAQMDANASR